MVEGLETVGSISTQSKSRKLAISALVVTGFALWIVLIAVGHVVLFEYELTAGPLTNTKRVFPHNSKVNFAEGRENVIMFLHPMCPCSIASVDEFSELMREGEKHPYGTVIALMPKETEPKWSIQPIFNTLRRIKNVRIVYDNDAELAKRFDVITSGHVLIYDQRGILQFSGGITESRGHRGENVYLDRAKQIILAKHPEYSTAPVYGCALR